MSRKSVLSATLSRVRAGKKLSRADKARLRLLLKRARAIKKRKSK